MAEATVVPDRAGEKVQQGAENAKRSGRAGPTLASIVAQWQQTIGNSGVAQLSAVSATETDPDAEPAPPSAVGAAAAVAEQSLSPNAGDGPAFGDSAREAGAPAAVATPALASEVAPGATPAASDARSATEPAAHVIEMEPMVITADPAPKVEHGAAAPAEIEMEPMYVGRGPSLSPNPGDGPAIGDSDRGAPGAEPGAIGTEPLINPARPPGAPATAGATTRPAKAASNDVTTPGFTERNASMKGKPAVAGATRSRSGGGPRGAGSGDGAAGSKKGGGGTSAPKPSLGDPALDKWKAATAPAIAGVNPGELADPKAGAGEVDKKGSELATTRKGTVGDPVPEAKAQQPPLPKEEPKQARLDTAEADRAIAAVAKAGEKKLSDQAFLAVGSPPKYEGAPLSPSDYVPKNLTSKAAELEAQLAGLTDPAKRAQLTRQLEQIKGKIAAIEASAARGPVPDIPTPIIDEGASKLTPPNPAMGDVLGDAIARAMQSVGTRSKSIVKGAVAAAHGDKVPKMLEMGTSEEPTLETELRTELTGIASAAGITKEQLDAKVIEQQAVVDAQKVAADDALHQATRAAVTTQTEQTQSEGAAIVGAKQAVQQEIDDKQAAVNGPPDTEAIEAKRDELLGTLESTSATAEAALHSALTKRNSELDEGAAEKKQKINAVASTQAAAIRRHWANDTDPNKGMVEARPTTEWAAAEVGKADGELKRMKEMAASESAAFAKGVSDQLQPGRDTIRDWAAHQEGTERSWWDRLIDMFRDWGHQARASNEAWEKQRNADSRDAMSKDLDVLAELKKAKLAENKGAEDAAKSKLSKEQQDLADQYLAGGVDSIGFVAESTMMRIAGRRKPELAKTFEERAVAEWDWESLGQLARATNPGFQPKVLANKVHGGVDGIGTNEAKVFEGLGGARTPVERAALDKCYLATFGSSMSADVEDDLSSEELDRGMALIEGDHAKADAAAIAEAVDGLGTDEQAIRDALRGKTPEELEAIKKAYREKYGVDLVADLRDDMGGAELDNALMLADGDVDGADAAELEDAMSGPGTDEDKMKKVYERIREEEEKSALAKGLTKAEVDQRIKDRNARVGAKYAAMGYGDLKANAKDELSDGDPLSADNADNKLFAALEAGDEKNIDAAKALVEKEGVYTSDDEVEKIVRNQRKKAEFDVNLGNAGEKARLQALAQSGDIPPDVYKAEMAKLDFSKEENKERREAEIAKKGKANVAQLKTQYESMANTDVSIALHGKNTFDSLVEDGTSGYSRAEINALLESGGKLSDAQEMYYATAGSGTDEEKIKETLKDKTPAEVQTMRLEYESLHGPGSFDADILGDLSGREDLDVGLNLKYGDPSTFARQLDEAKPEDRPKLLANFEAYLTTRRDFEKSGSVGSAMDVFGDGMNSADQLKDAIDRAKKYDEALFKAEHTPGYDAAKKGDNPDLVAAQANFDMNFQGAVQAQEEVREKIDAITDIAAQVGGAIAGIAVTILTAGTAGPAVLALYAACASAAASIALKMSMKGAAYGWEDLGIDIATGIVDGVVSAATAGMGAAVVASVEKAVMSVVARQAAKEGVEEITESAVKAFIKEAIEEGIENGVQAVPSAFVGSVLNGEDPVAAAKSAGSAGLQGAAMGVGMHVGMTGAGGAYSGIKGALKNEPTIETGGSHAHVEPHGGPGADTSLPDVDPTPADIHIDDASIKAAATEGGVTEPGALLGDKPDVVGAQVRATESGGPKTGGSESGGADGTASDSDGRARSIVKSKTDGPPASRATDAADPTSSADPKTASNDQPLGRPSPDDAGKALTTDDLASRYGMPKDNVTKIQEICGKRDVIVDLRPTTPHAEAMLRDNKALPKPADIKAKTISEIDVMIGLGTKDKLGQVGFFHPDQIRMPGDLDALPPDLQQKLRDRKAQRIEEWFDNREDMTRLVTERKVRVEADGTIVNTGLFGDKQLPFTGDHDIYDIRQSDGRPLSKKDYDAVVKELVAANVGVQHGAANNWKLDSPKTFDPEAMAGMERAHSAGGDQPLVRLGAGEPKAVWHEPYEIPEGTIFFTEGPGATDATANLDYFKKTVAADPKAEYALMRNTETGEYLVMQGNKGEVPIGETVSMVNAEVGSRPIDAGQRQGGHWVLEAHSHPIDPELGYTPEFQRLPSGATGDFDAAAKQVAATGKPFVSEIHMTTEIGPDITRFGLDPDNPEPYMVDFPGPAGTRVVERFETIDAYHDWYRGRYGQLGDIGAVPDSFNGPRLEPEPVTKRHRRVRPEDLTSAPKPAPAESVDPFPAETTSPAPDATVGAPKGLDNDATGRAGVIRRLDPAGAGSDVPSNAKSMLEPEFESDFESNSWSGRSGPDGDEVSMWDAQRRRAEAEPDLLADVADEPQIAAATVEQVTAAHLADAADPVGLTDRNRDGSRSTAELMNEDEYRSGVHAASEAYFDGITARRGKTGSTSWGSGVNGSESGWRSNEAYQNKEELVERVGVRQRDIGHETVPRMFDQGEEGRYENSHAERQQAELHLDVPKQSTRPLCPDCQRFFVSFALARGVSQFIADPRGVHVFTPDGRHWVQPHPVAPVPAVTE